MAAPERRGLTRGLVSLLTRLSTVVSVFFVLGGILLMLAPLPETTPAQEIAKAAPRRADPQTAVFPKFAKLTSERGNPFVLRQTRRSPLPEAPPAPEPEPMPEPPPVVVAPQPPLPDIDQLELVGTAPGSRRAFAVFTDMRNGLTFVVAEEQEVRNAVLKAVFPDMVVLALGSEERSIALTPIPGAEQVSGETRLRSEGGAFGIEDD